MKYERQIKQIQNKPFWKSKLVWLLIIIIALLFIGLIPVSLVRTTIDVCPEGGDCVFKEAECLSFRNIWSRVIFDHCEGRGFIWYGL